MNPGSVYCIGLTPALQRTMVFPRLRHGRVNRASSVSLSASGKAVNVSRVLKQLDVPVRLAGFLGGDSGRAVDDELKELGIKSDWVWVSDPTRNCHTLVDDKTGEVTELVEEMTCPSSREWDQLYAKVRAGLAQAPAAAISGKPPPGSDPECYARMLENGNGAKFVLDSQGACCIEALKMKPYMLKLNAEELARTFGTPRGFVEKGIKAAVEQGAQHVLVTEGPDLAVLFDGTRLHSIAPPSIDAVNPIGSGDAVTAGILYGLLQEWGLEKAAAYGIACGTAAALTDQPGILDKKQVDAFFDEISGISRNFAP